MKNAIALLALVLSVPSHAAYVVRDNSISTAKIKDGAITPAKKSASTIATTAGLGSVARSAEMNISTSASGGFTTVGTVTITTSGRPILLFTGSGPTGAGECRFFQATSTSSGLRIYRSSTTVVAQWDIEGYYGSGMSYMAVDQPSAGTYTYDFQRDYNGTSGAIARCFLYAVEL